MATTNGCDRNMAVSNGLVHGKEPYSTCFSPRNYLNFFYTHVGKSSGKPDRMQFFLSSLHEIFHLLPPINRLIDIGSGPSIHSVISASLQCDNIVMSDYAEHSRDELQLWLNRDIKMFDWSTIMNFVAELESIEVKDLEDKVRSAIRTVVPCDISLSEVVSPALGKFDCVVSSLCLEAICEDNDTYMEYLANMCRLLQPGGHLVLAGVLHKVFYQFDQYRFYCMQLSFDTVLKGLSKAGLSLVRDYKAPTDKGYAFVLVAKKL